VSIKDSNTKIFKLLSLSIFSGLILSASWPMNGFSPLLFIGFIPLLFVEDHFFQQNSRGGKKLIFYSYPAFFVWNLLTTWWVYKATLFGGAAAVICNSFFMAMVFQAFHFTRVKKGNFIGYSSFIIYWIGFEYLHLNWDLSWPWLSLGNGFATYTKWIQWYEYTGILGGSLWILILNIYLFLIIKRYIHNNFHSLKEIVLHGIATLLLIFVPYFISYYIYLNYHEKINPIHVVVVQPNIDPYNEKFSGSEEAQLTKFITLARSMVDEKTDYLIGPETALPSGIWEEEMQHSYSIRLLNSFLLSYPHLKIITGLSSYRHIEKKETGTTREASDASLKYEAYNTSIQLGPSGEIQIYHKSKLVPGVEQMPYPAIFKYIEKFAIDLGGTSGSLGKQEERTVFHSKEKISVCAAICYESIYGDFMSGFIRNGANLLFVITNDGWWGDTPGYKQHLNYGRLRAIEFRRSMARSANTGISCFIDSRGEISQPTEWWKAAVIKAEINSNDEITFYARHGDYIGRICASLSILLFLISLLIKKKH
jgi:apolipoprotein N-acyltransferase